MAGNEDSATLWAELLALGHVADGSPAADRCDELVRTLQRRGEPELLEWCVRMLSDTAPWQRRLAGQLLAQFGDLDDRPYRSVVTPALIGAAAVERDMQTLAELIDCLGSAQDPTAADELIRYAGHASADVRAAAARALPFAFLDSAEPSAEAIGALVELSADPSPRVRDWACFGLGLQGPDGPAIRAALAARLADPDDDARCEALLALAELGDARALAATVERLGADPDDVWLLELRAAAALTDPALYPALRRLVDGGDGADDAHATAAAFALGRWAPDAAERAAWIEAELVRVVNARLSGSGCRSDVRVATR
ncbi:MAG: HEAT repeat domain-containing protein [Jatrophihabitans sp.]